MGEDSTGEDSRLLPGFSSAQCLQDASHVSGMLATAIGTTAGKIEVLSVLEPHLLTTNHYNG